MFYELCFLSFCIYVIITLKRIETNLTTITNIHYRIINHLVRQCNYDERVSNLLKNIILLLK